MISTRVSLVLLTSLLTCTCWIPLTHAQSSDFIHRDFILDAALLSYLPDKGIEGYDQHGSGMSSVRGSLGLGVKIGDVSASVKIAPALKDGRFVVTIDLKPAEAKQLLGFEKKVLDLTDLKPLAIRLATTEKGRIYQLNLTPSVRVIDSTPQRLDVSKLKLHNWRFPDSPILVNDALYVGRLSCSQSPVAFVDISGVALVEFSLYQFTDSQPIGVLHNGVVTLTHPEDQTKIQISNVRNGGSHAFELPGRYRVWVRWSDSTHTTMQHRENLIKLRERLVSGDFPNTRVELLDKQLAREPSPWIFSGGVRGFRSGEQVVGTD